jgi:hypothetical protein
MSIINDNGPEGELVKIINISDNKIEQGTIFVYDISETQLEYCFIDPHGEGYSVKINKDVSLKEVEQIIKKEIISRQLQSW